MPVEIIVDNWNPRGRKKYRFETFCYGPLSCQLYKAGPNRKVEGRNGMVYIEEDWVDEMMTEHRDPDEWYGVAVVNLSFRFNQWVWYYYRMVGMINSQLENKLKEFINEIDREYPIELAYLFGS